MLTNGYILIVLVLILCYSFGFFLKGDRVNMGAGLTIAVMLGAVLYARVKYKARD